MASSISTPKSQHSEAELERRRAFLVTFRRWEILFKRRDGDTQADKWLIAEYYKSIGHLTADGLEALTDELKIRCTFFPSIRECLEVINPPKYTYSSPLYAKAALMFERTPQLGRETAQIEHREGQA